ncbi:MAG: hypothetical protein WDM92_16800 [Caulobacteraceae bacterium]
MAPADNGEVAVRYALGNAAMVSDGERGAVMLLPVRYDAGRKMKVLVFAFNKSSEPVNFGTEDVRIQLDDGDYIPVQDFDYLQVEAKRRAQAELVSAVVQAGVESAFAAYVSRRDPYQGRVLYRRAADQFYDNEQSIQAELASAVAMYARTVLQTTTVDPRHAFGGGVFAERLPVAPGTRRAIQVDVRFAGEPHRFLIRLAPEGTPLPIEPNSPAVDRGSMEHMLKTPRTWLWDRDPVSPPPAPVIE